jgi:hypothetical protein
MKKNVKKISTFETIRLFNLAENFLKIFLNYFF